MKRMLVLCLGGIIILSLYIMVLINKINTEVYVDNPEVINNNSNLLTMMLETDFDSNEYTVATSNKWPESGYTFNAELSYCEQGSALVWNEENKSVSLSTNISDKCYIYFDYIVSFFSIESNTYNFDNGMTWHEWINSDYNIDDYSINNTGSIINSSGVEIYYSDLSDITLNFHIKVNQDDIIIANNNYTRFYMSYLPKYEELNDGFEIIEFYKGNYNRLLQNDNLLNVVYPFNEGNENFAVIANKIENSFDYIKDESLNGWNPINSFVYVNILNDNYYDGYYNISFNYTELTEYSRIGILCYSFMDKTWYFSGEFAYIEYLDYSNKDITLKIKNLPIVLILLAK